ncbi:hypothetical protein EON79_09170 [bacterium]|nr:MAG: hypothetical protein EON79_09170 [bacterium]
MTPDERLARLAAGEEPKLIARMASGFAVMGDSQFLPGYCLLLASPKAGQLNELEGEDRMRFLADMAALGDAVRAATGCLRVNYSIYGNLDPFLHAHVWPRYADESEATRTLPPLTISAELRESVPYDEASHGGLREAIAISLTP